MSITDLLENGFLADIPLFRFFGNSYLVMADTKEETRKDGFQKFWTKDKTEALLSILEEQASKGPINHDLVAVLLTDKERFGAN